jgi:hypothetical protein
MMKKKIILIIVILLYCFTYQLEAQNIYDAVPQGVRSRWISPENPTGEKGKGGMTNKGAKGNAFYIVQPGETKP